MSRQGQQINQELEEKPVQGIQAFLPNSSKAVGAIPEAKRNEIVNSLGQFLTEVTQQTD